MTNDLREGQHSISDVIDTPDKALSLDADIFYSQLVSRNQHFISRETQDKLRSLKILVGGCGSGGGACLEPLARLGVENFKFADNGSYELTNLNRQRAYIANLGENKASYNLKLLKEINPFINAEAFPEGITLENVNRFVEWSDLIIDAVDVTNPTSISLKIALHECAKQVNKPVFSPLDVGFRQCGLGFDYRKKNIKVFDGRLAAAKAASHPIKALFQILPLSMLPTHCLPLAVELLEGKTTTGSQLAAASDLLSGVIAACVVRFADTGDIVRYWNIDLSNMSMSPKQRFVELFRRPFMMHKVRRMIAGIA